MPALWRYYGPRRFQAGSVQLDKCQRVASDWDGGVLHRSASGRWVHDTGKEFLSLTDEEALRLLNGIAPDLALKYFSERPPTGAARVMVYMAPSLKEQLRAEAGARGMTMNAYICQKLASKAGKTGAL